MLTLRRAACGAAILLAALAVSLTAADVRVYVQFVPGQRAAVDAVLAQAGARQHHEFVNLNALAVSLPEGARPALARNPVVTLIEDDPVRRFLAQTVPYGIPLVQADLAVAAGATGAGIKVGVIDSGVYVGHADLAGVAITGEPYLGGSDPRNWNRDYYSHGTHVVGTLAAVDNNFGVLGVSPGSVVLHLVKVFGDGGSWIYSSDTLAAARSAAAKGAKIVSMSLGGTGRSRTEDAGMADLYNRGVLLVAAAGNDGNTDTSYPAGYDSVISVAAIDSTKAVASFSQQNADVELAAPGKSVLSTVSYIDTTFVLSGADSFDALHMEFAARGTASAPLVYGGIGRTGDRSWSGKVVLLDRGTNTFYEKIRNVQRSGGVACIIANNEAGELSGTLGEGNTSTIPAVGITQADGATLASRVGSTVTVSTNVQNDATAYEEFDGTSMATPHVSGVAALIWSKYRGATNVQVRQALVGTAEDLGAGGRDSVFGYGLVRAKAALDALAAMNPGPAPTDTTAPIISNLNVANPRPGILEFTWTTNEPASSDVELDGYASLEGTLTQSHVRTFRVLRGSHIYRVTSTDAAGNATTTDIATTSL